MIEADDIELRMREKSDFISEIGKLKNSNQHILLILTNYLIKL
jgi:hypothetical protein